MGRERLKRYDIIWVNGFVDNGGKPVRPHWFLIDKIADKGRVFTAGQGKEKRSYDLKCYMLSSLNWDNTHKLDAHANMYLDRSQSTLGIRKKKDSYVKMDTVYLFDTKTLEYVKTDQLLEKGKETFAGKEETLKLMRNRNIIGRGERNLNNVLPTNRAMKIKEQKPKLIFLPRMPQNKHAAYSKENHMSKVASEELNTPLTSQGCYLGRNHLTELSDTLMAYGERDENKIPYFKSSIEDQMTDKVFSERVYLRDFREIFQQKAPSKHEAWDEYLARRPDIPDFTCFENKGLDPEDYTF